MPASGSAMSSIITSVGSIVTGATSWASTVIGFITDEGNELCLFMCLVPFIYTGVHLLKKLTTV